jgi:hypothetical protein
MLQLALIFLILPLKSIDSQYSGLFGSYTNNKVLVSNVYNLFWNVTSDSLIAEIQVKTIGWFGFGISPTGGMDGSDLIVTWINSNGKTNFTDRHIVGRKVLIDSEQNWFLLKSQKLNGYTTIQFKRLINSCDVQDMIIPNGTVKVIISWNDALPADGEDISYHGPNNRYLLSVIILNAISQPLIITPADKIETYNFSVNVKLIFSILF